MPHSEGAVLTACIYPIAKYNPKCDILWGIYCCDVEIEMYKNDEVGLPVK